MYRFLKLKLLLVALLISLAAPGSGALQAHAADRVCTDLLVREMRGVVSAGEFNDFRGIQDYNAILGARFVAHLARLIRGNRWLDIGAGHARAQKEYLAARLPLARSLFKGKANVVAVAAEAPKSNHYSRLIDRLAKHPLKFQGLFGRYVEDIPDEELGRADIITDVFGAVSYSERMDLVLNKYLRVLNPQGAIYLHVISDHTKIIRKDGSEVPLAQWLQATPGLDVQIDAVALTITADRPGVILPALKLIGGRADAPPQRVFQEI